MCVGNEKCVHIFGQETEAHTSGGESSMVKGHGIIILKLILYEYSAGSE